MAKFKWKTGALEIKCLCILSDFSFLVIFLLLSFFIFYHYVFWSYRFQPNKWWCFHPVSHPAHSGSSNSQRTAVHFRALLWHRLDLSCYRWPAQSCQICMNILQYLLVSSFLFLYHCFSFEKTSQILCPVIFFHILPSACCMIISLGPVIQVLLSCLLHSTQSIFTSSIRPHAYLCFRYSIEDKTNVCRWMCSGH